MSKILNKLGLLNVRNISYQQILNNLMDPSHGLGMKSRIPKPKPLAILDSVGVFYKKLNLNDSSEMVKGFIKTILTYFVSEKGLGRKEIVKALSYLIEDEKRRLSGSEKMTTNLRKL